ncbi:hydrogenase iron-sulfur subunit [Chloroflexota bacterium]
MTTKSKCVSFEPRILGFLCQWCGYAGADLAGVSRFRYPHNIRVVRVMCSGRIDTAFIVDAFLKGMDGVMVIGCHPGDCHYLTGNHEAVNMVFVAKILLEYAGMNPDRLFLDWVSASEGVHFSRLVTDFTETIRKMGPLGKGSCEQESDLRDNLDAATVVARGDKLRYLLGKFSTFTQEGNVYGEVFTRHEMSRLVRGVILDELTVSRILRSLERGPIGVKEISDDLNCPSSYVLQLMMNLIRKGIVVLNDIQERTPRYVLTTPQGSEL